MKISETKEFWAIASVLFDMYAKCARDETLRSVVAVGDEAREFVLMLFEGNGDDFRAVKKFLEERDK